MRTTAHRTVSGPASAEASLRNWPCLAFAQAATQETLKRLSLETLCAVLTSDNLRVPSELHVFHSVLTWIQADPDRTQAAAQVPLLSKLG